MYGCYIWSRGKNNLLYYGLSGETIFKGDHPRHDRITERQPTNAKRAGNTFTPLLKRMYFIHNPVLSFSKLDRANYYAVKDALKCQSLSP